MDKKIPGKIGITVKEPWADNISYEILDMTLFSTDNGGDGCSYVALKDNIGVRPGTDPTTWRKATQAGQSIYDLAVKYGHFEGTEEEFEAEYQAALAAANAAASAASATNQQVQTAEASRVSAENARVTAETGRQTAETARVNAENTRDTAETNRQTAETGRTSAESGRVIAENQRQSNESARATAENARDAAELSRAQTFGSLETDMQTAIGQADAAASAASGAASSAAATEASVSAAEASRVLAEAGRVSAESGRVTAETGRVNAETARATAETGRANAETARVAAETARETQASSDHNTAAADHTRAGTDHTTAAADHTQAESDHTRAESDHASIATIGDKVDFIETSFGKYDAIRGVTLTRAKDGKYVNVDGGETSASGYGISNPVELNFGDMLLVPSASAVPASVSVVSRIVTRTYQKVINYTYTYQQANPELYDTATADYDSSLVYAAVYDTTGETPVLTGWTKGGQTYNTLPATHDVTESYYEPLVKQAVSAMPSTGYYIYLCPSAMTVVISGYTATVNGGVCLTVGWGIFKNIVSNFLSMPGQNAVAQALCDLLARVEGICERLENLGDTKAKCIDFEDIPKVCDGPMVIEGTGSPSVLPRFVGQRYHDTTANAKHLYEAFAVTGNLSDWVLIM